MKFNHLKLLPCCLFIIIFINIIFMHFVLPNSITCPVSSIKSNYDEFFTYPVDIYAPHCTSSSISNCDIRNKSKSFVISNTTFFTCYSCELNQVGNHTCSRDISICPLDEHNINKAIEKQKKWIYSSVLCDLKATLPLKNITNHFIIIGGSVTAGVATFGNTNKKGSPSPMQCSFKTSLGAFEQGSWAHRLSVWTETLGTNVKLYNLAHPGYNARTYQDELRTKLNQISYHFQPSSSDIILIDLSVNDANLFNTVAKSIQLKRSLEALVRTIYKVSRNNSTPAIVLLEQFIPTNTGFELDYSEIYQEIAMYYNISLWSYRDVVTDPYILHTEKQSAYRDHLLWKYNIIGGAHPPWHNHLYYADLIGAIMQQQFQACPTSILQTSDNSNTKEVDLTNQYQYPILKSYHELPSPIYQSKFHQCNDLMDPLLFISANDVYQSRNNYTQDMKTDFGSHKMDVNKPLYRSFPSSGWKIYEDRVGRPGFIHEFNHSDLTNIDIEPSIVKLVFYLNTSQPDFFTKVDKTPLLLQISYLRTYRNAGQVKILHCNNPMIDDRYNEVTLDALWSDYHIFKFSIPEIFSIPIGRCKNNDGTSTIELVHFSNHRNEIAEIKKARGNEKFKLLQIRVCNIG